MIEAIRGSVLHLWSPEGSVQGSLGFIDDKDLTATYVDKIVKRGQDEIVFLVPEERVRTEGPALVGKMMPLMAGLLTYGKDIGASRPDLEDGSHFGRAMREYFVHSSDDNPVRVCAIAHRDSDLEAIRFGRAHDGLPVEFVADESLFSLSLLHNRQTSK